ncbi:IS1 family transposase, partial [Escherichia coli]|uniref:IS1 family transposase n=1 Tax=Escherichia coli TaxID=562 RepID=UPI0034D405A0
FATSVELHDKVLGHYLNIKHYHSVGVITAYIYFCTLLLHCVITLLMVIKPITSKK